MRVFFFFHGLNFLKSQNLELLLKIRKNNFRKIAIIFLSIGLNMYFDSQKNPLIEAVLLSSHNLCFG